MKSHEIALAWKKLIVGQDHVIDKITPYVARAKAGLNSPNRPLGVFFLMGPTGTGKTRTAETLAELLHNSEKNIIRIDCAEFQQSHEVAKLIGAPPGYLGHKETQPIITTTKLTAITSDHSTISIVLFDEIEKATPDFWRVLLGIMDKGQLRLGDNSIVGFENTILFLSSNLGAKGIGDMMSGGIGFSDKKPTVSTITESNVKTIESIGKEALKRHFSPEFLNRLDEIISYHPLNEDNLRDITRVELNKLRQQIHNQLGKKAFHLLYDDDAIAFLTKAGSSIQYGAREIKRAITRFVLNPLADELLDGNIAPSSYVGLKSDSVTLTWDIEPPFFTFEEDPAGEEKPVEAPPVSKKQRRYPKP